MADKTIVGIDLGTTYSCISRVDEYGQPVVIPNKEGELTTPSVVYFEDSGNIVVGATAKDAIRTDALRVVSKVKRQMGDSKWRFPIDGKEYRAEEISALILKKIVADAALNSGIEIEEAVITCPAYFSTAQKEATKIAGEIAGLKVRYVIPEPTAAAIAYGMKQDKDETVLVYDLGGGTFDITLVDIRSEKLTVRSTDGDAELGGFNWDQELARLLARQVADECDESLEDLIADAEFYPELLLHSEGAKKILTTSGKNRIPLFYGGQRVTAEVTREQFDKTTEHLLERTISTTREVYDRASSTPGMNVPSRLMLVGGSTYMPQVRQRLEAEFPGLEIRHEDPNQIVANGAAIFGLKMMIEDDAIRIINDGTTGANVESMAGVDDETKREAFSQAGAGYGLPAHNSIELGCKEVTNVTARSFGLEVYDEILKDERIENFIHVDDPVPIELTKTYGTMFENQKTVEIKIFENEIRTSRDDCQVDVGSCILLADPDLIIGSGHPKGSPIDVTFQLSADGMLNVLAMHQHTGIMIDVHLQVEGVMTDDQVEASKKTVGGLAVS